MAKQDVESILTKRIRASAETLIHTPNFKSWLTAHPLKEGSLVGINSSFVFRTQLKTTKNHTFLSLTSDNKGAVSSAELGIASGTEFNSDFKAFSKKSENLPTIEALEVGVKRELVHFGKLAFVLVGHIEDNIQISQPINHGLFGPITLDPAQGDLLKLDERAISIRDTFDEEALWQELSKKALDQKLIAGALPDDLREPFANALNKLTAESYAALRLPNAKGGPAGATLLASMVGVLKQHAGDYKKALFACQGDPQKDASEFNNVLRIAYNFSSDAAKVIRLLVSICDLKPLLFWLTVVEWFELSDHFKNLPWAKSKKKPSLADYHETISGARNRAFHNIFPFNKALEASLDGVSLSAVKLRIFSEYKAKKSQNVFEYEDKALVEILTEFTRAGERIVQPLFWKKNLDVMNSAVSLISSISDSLILLTPFVMK